MASDIRGETVTYSAKGTTLKGYLAYDHARSGKRPAVLVAPEWWGVNDYIRERARMIAELGYTALAVDMYGDGKTAATPDEAGKLMTAVLGDMATGEARFEAALALARGHETVDPAHTAAIGYCFGGAVVLHAARKGLDLACVASFHGSLGSMHTPGPGSVRAKILVCHGAADEFVPDADVEAFKREMDAAKADYRFIAYEGAKHGFSSREADENGRKYGLPLAYDANADRSSWDEMKKLFAETLA